MTSKLQFFTLIYIDGLVQKDATPVRQQWSYIFLALTQRHVDMLNYLVE